MYFAWHILVIFIYQIFINSSNLSLGIFEVFVPVEIRALHTHLALRSQWQILGGSDK